MPRPLIPLSLRYTSVVSLFGLLSVLNPCRRYLKSLPGTSILLPCSAPLYFIVKLFPLLVKFFLTFTEIFRRGAMRQNNLPPLAEGGRFSRGRAERGLRPGERRTTPAWPRQIGNLRNIKPVRTSHYSGQGIKWVSTWGDKL